jgi:hypothetical protein
MLAYWLSRRRSRPRVLHDRHRPLDSTVQTMLAGATECSALVKAAEDTAKRASTLLMRRSVLGDLFPQGISDTVDPVTQSAVATAWAAVGAPLGWYAVTPREDLASALMDTVPYCEAASYICLCIYHRGSPWEAYTSQSLVIAKEAARLLERASALDTSGCLLSEHEATIPLIAVAAPETMMLPTQPTPVFVLSFMKEPYGFGDERLPFFRRISGAPRGPTAPYDPSDAWVESVRRPIPRGPGQQVVLEIDMDSSRLPRRPIRHDWARPDDRGTLPVPHTCGPRRARRLQQRPPPRGPRPRHGE